MGIHAVLGVGAVQKFIEIAFAVPVRVCFVDRRIHALDFARSVRCLKRIAEPVSIHIAKQSVQEIKV